jgi:hypothetical protein
MPFENTGMTTAMSTECGTSASNGWLVMNASPGDVVAEALADRPDDARQRRDVQRGDDVFAHDLAARVEDQTARVVRFPDDRRVTGAEDVVLHLLDDPRKPADEDLKRNRVDRHVRGTRGCLWPRRCPS